MDRTLHRAKRHSRRRGQRNQGAWQRFSPDGVHCRYCKHDGARHLVSSAQPHFYRRATAGELANPSVTLYRHGSVLVRRQPVTRDAELVVAFCTACAESLGTEQVLCYQRTLGIGEVIGVGDAGRKREANGSIPRGGTP